MRLLKVKEIITISFSHIPKFQVLRTGQCDRIKIVTYSKPSVKISEMNSKHLTAGEQCPALLPGSLRIYSMRYCPYAQRALLAAAAKGISYDVVNINLVHKPEFIFPKNPEGKVPTIETNDGKVLFESLIICDYIDEAYNDLLHSGGDAPVRRLHPTDPFQKALDRIWTEKFSKISNLDFQLYFSTNLGLEQITSIINQLNEQLLVFDKELKRRGTKFFAGSIEPGMLDYMIWPWMERLPSFDLIYKNEASLLHEGWRACSSLEKWRQDMTQDKAVQASYLSPEIHAEYRKMRRSGGNMNYDFMHCQPN